MEIGVGILPRDGGLLSPTVVGGNGEVLRSSGGALDDEREIDGDDFWPGESQRDLLRSLPASEGVQ